MATLVSGMVLNGASSAVCNDPQCTDVKIDYKGYHGQAPTAYVLHTPCATTPGGPEIQTNARAWEDNHVCIRKGTRLRIGPVRTLIADIDITTNDPQIHVLCRATESPFCIRVN